MSTKIVCPKCELADRIQKVSAIIASGTSRQATTSSASVSVTDLASILALPNPPREPMVKPVLWWDKIDVQKWLIMILVPFPLAIIIINRVLELIIFPLRVELPEFVVILLFIAIVFISFYAVNLFLKNARKTRPYVPNSTKIEQENALLKEGYEAKLQAYNEQKAKWSRLYYCHRDDFVFEPLV